MNPNIRKWRLRLTRIQLNPVCRVHQLFSDSETAEERIYIRSNFGTIHLAQAAPRAIGWPPSPRSPLSRRVGMTWHCLAILLHACCVSCQLRRERVRRGRIKGLDAATLDSSQVRLAPQEIPCLLMGTWLQEASYDQEAEILCCRPRDPEARTTWGSNVLFTDLGRARVYPSRISPESPRLPTPSG